MKKLLFLLVFIACMTATNGQISLENNYSGSVGLTNLAISGYKYFQMDVINNQCRIYNLDHSIWKVIALSVPQDNYLYDMRYVSENLFNSDTKVELVYTYYNYDTSLYYYTYHSRVIDEDGIELLDIPGCSYVNVLAAGSDTYKMMAYVYDYSLINWTVNTLVYALPGTLPSSGVPVEGDITLPQPYPNPSHSVFTIPYQLPDGVNTGEILLTDHRGKPIGNYTVDRYSRELTIGIDGLPSGVYYYRLTSGDKILNTGKLVQY
jgi:hypothetical protein